MSLLMGFLYKSEREINALSVECWYKYVTQSGKRPCWVRTRYHCTEKDKHLWELGSCRNDVTWRLQGEKNYVVVLRGNLTVEELRGVLQCCRSCCRWFSPSEVRWSSLSSILSLTALANAPFCAAQESNAKNRVRISSWYRRKRKGWDEGDQRGTQKAGNTACTAGAVSVLLSLLVLQPQEEKTCRTTLFLSLSLGTEKANSFLPQLLVGMPWTGHETGWPLSLWDLHWRAVYLSLIW